MSILSEIKYQVLMPCAEKTGNVMKNCGFDNNFLGATIQPFNALLGGYLPMVFWAIVVGALYAKYHNAGLAGVVGIFVLMGGNFLLPDKSEIAITMMVGSAFAIGLYYLIFRIKRTEE